MQIIYFFIFPLVFFFPNFKALLVNGKYICSILLNQVGYKTFCCITNNSKILLAYKTKFFLCMGDLSIQVHQETSADYHYSGTSVDRSLTLKHASLAYSRQEKSMASYALALPQMIGATHHFCFYVTSQITGMARSEASKRGSVITSQSQGVNIYKPKHNLCMQPQV